MAILAGIDEAGLGPLLGPLVVSGVAFRVPEERVTGCLWDILRESCTATPRRAARRLVIADSKRLYRSGHIAPLERAALVMLGVMNQRPATWRELLDQLAPGATNPLDRYPWYAGRDVPLPLSDEVGDLGTQANAVRRNCAEQGVSLAGIHSEPMTAGHLNRLMGRTGNKSVVSLGLTLRVVDRIIRSTGGEAVHFSIDRHGGRIHSRESLMTSWPGYDLAILEESPTRSAYRMVRSSQVYHIEFVTRGEAQHFTVALASVYSKYLRELYMHMFNRYWSEEVPRLRPTAGYYNDALRWLSDVEPELDRRAVDRSILVRNR